MRKKKQMHLKTILPLLLISIFSSAQADELENIDTLTSTIKENLTLGDSKDKVEEFLKISTWSYAYDKHQTRFQARPEDGTYECKIESILLWLFYECGIQIHISIDKHSNFSGYNVTQIYTGI